MTKLKERVNNQLLPNGNAKIKFLLSLLLERIKVYKNNKLVI